MALGKEIGRVSIRVVPDATRFADDLRRALKRIENTARVKVPIRLDDDFIARDFKRINDRFEKAAKASGRAQIPVAPDFTGFRALLKAGVELHSAGVKVDIPVTIDQQPVQQLAENLGKVSQQMVTVDRRGGGLTRVFRLISEGAVKGAGGVIKLAGGFANLVAVGGQAGASLVEVGGNLFKLGTGASGAVGKIAGVAAGFLRIALIGGLAGGAIGLVSSALLAVAGAAGTLVSILPAAFAAAIVPIATVAAGIDGIKNAAGVLTDEMKSLKTAVSAAFEQGLTPAFKTLERVFTVLQPQMVRVAEGMSKVAREAANFLASKEGLAAIRAIFDGVAVAAQEALPGISALGEEFLKIAGLEGVYRVLGDLVGTLAERFAGFLAEARSSGDLVNTFGALRDIFIAASGAMGELVDNGMDFLQGAAPGLTQFFENLERAFSKTDFKSLGKAFGEMVAALGNIDPKSVGTFFKSVEGLFGAIEDFAASGNLTLLLDGLSTLTGIFSGLVSVLDLVLAPLRLVFDVIKALANSGAGQLVADALGAIGGAAGIAEEALRGLLGPFGQLDRIIGLAGDAIKGLADRFGIDLPFIESVTETSSAGATNALDKNLGRMVDIAALRGAATWKELSKNLSKMPPTARTEGSQAATQFGAGIAPMSAKGAAEGRATVSATENAVSGFSLFDIGLNLAGSLASGISAGASTAVNAAVSLGLSVMNAAKGVLGISSPSKVFRRIGEFTLTGFVQGILRNRDQVVSAFKNVIGRVVRFVRRQIPQIGRAISDALNRFDLGVDLESFKNPQATMTGNGLFIPEPFRENEGYDVDALRAAFLGTEFQIDDRGGRVLARVVNAVNRRNDRR